MLKAGPGALQPIEYEPQLPGIEVEDAGYVDWLLAGGEPLPEYHMTAWADTQ